MVNITINKGKNRIPNKFKQRVAEIQKLQEDDTVKTVAEFAREMDVSVQTIYRRLNKVKQINDEGLTVKKDGITYITVLGENALTGRLTDVKQQDESVFNGSDQINANRFNEIRQSDNQHETNMFNGVKQSEVNTFNTTGRAGVNSLENSGKSGVDSLNRVKHENGNVFNGVKQANGNMFNSVEQANDDALNNVKQLNADTFNDVKQPVKHPESADIAYFKEQNRILHEELVKEREHSRAQADRLASLAEQLAELSRNNQILLGAEQSRTNPALLSTGEQSAEVEEQPVRKKGFWNLFKKQ